MPIARSATIRGSHYQFGPFRFDAKGRVLFRGNKDLGLPPKAAETLLILVTHAPIESVHQLLTRSFG